MREWGRCAMAAVMTAAVLLGACAGTARAEAPHVVATIKPIHALVAQVMQGVGEPRLLVQGMASAHTYTLKPSDARALNNADIVFRVSDALEPFLTKIMTSLPRSVTIVTLADAAGLKLLPRRFGHVIEPVSGSAHLHVGSAAGHADAVDGHIWLDPGNAKILVASIAEALSRRDPAHADRYRANAQRFSAHIDAIDADLARELRPLAAKSYVVFHDAYQYLERRYALSAVGAIAISPEVPPSAQRLIDLRRKVQQLGASCIFSEPQFQSSLVATVAEGTGARTGTLDPEGATLEPGPGLYEALMRRLAGSLTACLGAGA